VSKEEVGVFRYYISTTMMIHIVVFFVIPWCSVVGDHPSFEATWYFTLQTPWSVGDGY